MVVIVVLGRIEITSRQSWVSRVMGQLAILYDGLVALNKRVQALDAALTPQPAMRAARDGGWRSKSSIDDDLFGQPASHVGKRQASDSALIHIGTTLFKVPCGTGARRACVTKYRPDQARDDHGRWVDEGGGVSHGRTPVGLSPLRQEFEAVLGQKAGKTPATQLRRRLRSYYQQRIDQTRASLAVGKPDAAEQRRVRARVEELKRRLDMLDELSGKVVRAEHGGRLRDMAERMRITPSTTERDLLSHIDEIKNTKLTKKELQTLMRGMGMQARPKSYSASKLKADVLGSLRSALSLVRRLNATRGRSAA